MPRIGCREWWEGGSAEARLSSPLPPWQGGLPLSSGHAFSCKLGKPVCSSGRRMSCPAHGEWPVGRLCLGFIGSANIYRVLSMCRHCLLCGCGDCLLKRERVRVLESLSKSGKVQTVWASCL